MSPEQVELVQSVLEKAHRREAVLVLATDNDEAGQRLARQVAGLAPQGMVIERDTPQAKDWNDDLQAQAQAQAWQRFDRGLGR
jgi:5S rRNA maturation endonuclease (ribonuclease M5)